MPLTDRSPEQQRFDAPAKTTRWVAEYCRFLVAAAFVISVLWAVYQVRYGVVEPIRWKAYSEDKRDTALANGRTVLVLLYSEYAPESEAALRSFDTNSATKLCKCSNLEPLLLRHHWEGHDINSIWKQVGHSKYPRLVVYSPNMPPVSYDPLPPQISMTDSPQSAFVKFAPPPCP